MISASLSCSQRDLSNDALFFQFIRTEFEFTVFESNLGKKVRLTYGYLNLTCCLHQLLLVRVDYAHVEDAQGPRCIYENWGTHLTIEAGDYWKKNDGSKIDINPQTHLANKINVHIIIGENKAGIDYLKKTACRQAI